MNSLVATAQRARVVIALGDPHDVSPNGRSFRVAFADRLSVWHLSSTPNGRVFVLTEHNGLMTSTFEIDDDFAALDFQGAATLAVLWRRMLAGVTEIRR